MLIDIAFITAYNTMKYVAYKSRHLTEGFFKHSTGVIKWVWRKNMLLNVVLYSQAFKWSSIC